MDLDKWKEDTEWGDSSGEEKIETTMLLLHNKYGTYTIELPKEDMSISEMLEMFEDVLKAAGYSWPDGNHLVFDKEL